MLASLRRFASFFVLVGLLLAGCNAQPDEAKLEEQVLTIIRDNPEVILESVGKYQQEQQATQAAEQEQQLAQLKTALEPYAKNPAAAIGDSPTQGSDKQTLVMYEFSDFQCPFCGRSQETVKQFMAAHGDTVTQVFKHFPLTSIHDQALPAAQAAWAAQQQGKFWEYHDALFANQDNLGEELYLKIAQDLELDIETFNSDRPKAKAAIEADLAEGEKLGLKGTPFFTINGVPLPGAVPLQAFEAALAEAQSTQAN
jgi:protein-disulfide isomerase